MLFDAWLYAALAAHGFATIAWIALLRHVAPQMAYPFVALAFFFVPLLAHWILDQVLRWQSFSGAALIPLRAWVSVGMSAE